MIVPGSGAGPASRGPGARRSARIRGQAAVLQRRLLARAHRIRSALLPVLAHRAEPIPAGRTAARGMAPHP